MSILGSSWMPEGYYEDCGYGDYYIVDDPHKIRELHSEGKLYEHDGISMSKVSKTESIKVKKRKYHNE